MSFTNAPVTRSLVYGLVGFSIASSLLDIKHYFYILVDVHLWRFHQTWRALIFQLCYTNSTEVLFAAMAFYNMKTVEHLWGSRKYASFIIFASAVTSVLTPTILALVLRPLTFNVFNYLPAGPTPIIFSILAQYHAMIPHMYKYRLATSASPPTRDQFHGLTLSNKSYIYLLAAQLALFQWPGSLLGAVVGWITGYAWRMEVLPPRITKWRLPGWMVGIRTQRRSEDFDGLRRMLEGGNSSTGTATGVQSQADGEVGRRRTMGQQVMDQFRGAF